jgi:hypothetical protein
METDPAFGGFRFKIWCCIANFHKFSSADVLRLRLSQVLREKSILALGMVTIPS